MPRKKTPPESSSPNLHHAARRRFGAWARGLGGGLLLTGCLASSCKPPDVSSFSGLGFPPGATNSYANAVSGDGKVVVGWSDSALGEQAFRWTATGGMVGLDDLTGGKHSTPNAASSDGSVVVGSTMSGSDEQAFRWTAAGGMVGLGGLPGLKTSYANAVSGDGKVVVGWSDSALGEQAFRWTATGSMVGLGALPGGYTKTLARVLSSDGSIILGESYSASGSQDAFIWDNVNGMRSLQLVLTTDYKLDLTGWMLTKASGISADGKTIVGTGKHNGHKEAWVAHLDRPPNRPATKGQPAPRR